MKLSEAIRLGSMLRPQAFGDLRRDGGSCAMGAAYEAVGVNKFSNRALKPWADKWNLLSPGRCPECDTNMYTALCAMAAHLNDAHEWTREQIADWVATMEPSETTSADHQPVDVRGTTETGEPVLSIRVRNSSSSSCSF